MEAERKKKQGVSSSTRAGRAVEDESKEASFSYFTAFVAARVEVSAH
jgi:hypothetical protein